MTLPTTEVRDLLLADEKFSAIIPPENVLRCSFQKNFKPSKVPLWLCLRLYQTFRMISRVIGPLASKTPYSCKYGRHTMMKI